MVYPMCYLYRNDIELLLKAIIIEFSDQSLQAKCAASYENKHSSTVLENIRIFWI